MEKTSSRLNEFSTSKTKNVEDIQSSEVKIKGNAVLGKVVYGTSESIAIPKPIILKQPDLEIKRSAEPILLRIRTSNQVRLNNNERLILGILYKLRNVKILDLIFILSNILKLSTDYILNLTNSLYDKNLVQIHEGHIIITPKGKAVASNNLPKEIPIIAKQIKEYMTLTIRSPKIDIKNLTLKYLDKRLYLQHVQLIEKKVFPAIHLPMIKSFVKPSLKNLVKTITNVQLYTEKHFLLIQIPLISVPVFNVKQLDKECIDISRLESEGIGYGGTGSRISLLTILFESKPKIDENVSEVLKVSPERPVVVIAMKKPNEDYEGTLRTILSEIHRIKVGGIPLRRSVKTQKSKDIVEDEPVHKDMIKIIDENTLKDIDLDKLKDRLIEQREPSFLILYLSEDKAKEWYFYLSMLKDKIAPTKILITKLRELRAEQKAAIARMCWGFIDPDTNCITVDEHFKLREDKFFDKLEEIMNNVAIFVKESEGDEEGVSKESQLHYMLKSFMFYYLIHKMNIPKEFVNTEEKLSCKNRIVVPDVYDKSRRIAIEVETLYGTWPSPSRKLLNTIKKYEGCISINKVWIVIPPLQSMLYLDQLYNLSKEFKKYNNVELYTINLKAVNLVSIEELAKKLEKIIESREDV